MQYAKTLLSVSLIAGSLHAQAEYQPREQNNLIFPNVEMQSAQPEASASTKQKHAKNLKGQTAAQPKAASQNRVYEVPLSDYNNGGHFGN